jgi:hypothetical protein
VRRHGSGAADRAWGGDGLVRSNFGTGADWAGAVNVQRNGKIAVGGAICNSQGVAQYLSM